MSSFGVTEFNLAIEYALRVLGLEKLTLKQAQRHAIYQIVSEGRDVLALLPAAFGKSFVYQILALISRSLAVFGSYISTLSHYLTWRINLHSLLCSRQVQFILEVANNCTFQAISNSQ